MKRFEKIQTAAIFLLSAMAFGVPGSANAEPTPLGQVQHIHGITVNPINSSRLLLATHYGLFSATTDGFTERASVFNADMMSFAVDPANPRRLFSSGHPEKGGNLGVMASKDGGSSWKRLSDGAKGPVDFHALTVSPMNSKVLYGIHEGLQKSSDGGVNWQVIGKAPEKLFALAASAINNSTLYAATMKGLMISRDGGKTWQAGFIQQKPATMVHLTPAGRIYVFVYGTGLLTATESDFTWKTISSEFQDRALMSFAIDPKNPDRLFAVTDTGTVMASKNGGKQWTSFEGFDSSTPETIRKGQALYVENCQECHGVKGIGERPGEPNARDDFGFVAPALNDDAHGWHHPDKQLVETILNGSPRNERMIAWRKTLSEKETETIVTYIKSLWSFRSLACQGTKHTACMQ